jgi:hypothetical protein
MKKLEDKLGQLEKEHGDIGGYGLVSEIFRGYAQKAKETFDAIKSSEQRLIKDRDKAIDSLKLKLRDEYAKIKTDLKSGFDHALKDQNKKVLAGIDAVKKKAEERSSGLSKRISALEKAVKVQKATDYKPGILGIRIGYDKTNGYSELNGTDIEVSDGKRSFFLTTSTRKSRIFSGSTRKAYCERKLPGGNYDITVHLNGEKIKRKTTVNGNRYLWIGLPLETRKPKDGVLLIRLCDGYQHHFPDRRLHNNEVEIAGSNGKIYLATKMIPATFGGEGEIEKNGSVCKQKLPGGNYTVTSIVEGQKRSQRITVDGNTNLILRYDKLSEK